MVICSVTTCQNTLGNNNKSGFCRLCSNKRKKRDDEDEIAASSTSALPKIEALTDLNNGPVSPDSELSSEMLDSPLTQLTVAGLANLLKLLYQPLEVRLNDFETELVTLKSRVSDIEKKSSSTETSLEAKCNMIKELEKKVKLNETIHKQHKDIKKVIDNHQSFLEKTDAFRREKNVVVFGVEESDASNDETDVVKRILMNIECPNIEPVKVMRLGKPLPPTAEPNESEPRIKKRPLLVILNSSQQRKQVLGSSSKLKTHTDEFFHNIYIKKDQSPCERKEWSRLRQAFSREKSRPENAGFEVKLDYRRRCVKVGDRIVEQGNFRRGPEM